MNVSILSQISFTEVNRPKCPSCDEMGNFLSQDSLESWKAKYSLIITSLRSLSKFLVWLEWNVTTQLLFKRLEPSENSMF